jgi:hypothetical protein
VWLDSSPKLCLFLAPINQSALALASHLVHADRKVTVEEDAFLKQLAAKVDLPENEAKMIVVAIEALNRDMLDS